MMDNVTVGIDLDNTLWNLGETVVDMLNDKYNLDVKYEDCVYDLDAVFSKYEPYKHDNPNINDWYYLAAKEAMVYSDARTVINFIKKELGYDVYFCTSSTPNELVVKDARLKRMFGWYDGTQLICCHNKKLCTFTIMIDDIWSHFNDKIEVPLLFSQPYNKDITGCYRVDDWLSVLKHIITYDKVINPVNINRGDDIYDGQET